MSVASVAFDAGNEARRMSVASVAFNAGNKVRRMTRSRLQTRVPPPLSPVRTARSAAQGFLTKGEKAARGMADKEGKVDTGAIVGLVVQNRALKKGQRRLAGLSLFLLAALVVTGALLGVRLDRATRSTQDKIEESTTTEIAEDAEGLPHLVDKASRSELAVRSGGNTFDARQVINPSPPGGLTASRSTKRPGW